MRRGWLLFAACVLAPHIMLLVGLIYLTKTELDKKNLGRKLALVSTGVLIVGSLLYYILCTPFFGLD
ncbi:MAG: hypothetical protein WCG78_05860 [Candidatus Omnitrophota bacterium]